MFKVSIQPDWQLQTQDGDAVARRLIDLLVGIHESGSLAGTCARSDVLYRYAWGILQRGQKIFGSPLVTSSRGSGAKLTALGEKLV